MGTNRFQKFLGTEHFGSRLFRFGSSSNRTNRIFLEDLRTTINIPIVWQIYATLCSFFIIIMYKKTITIQYTQIYSSSNIKHYI